MMDYLSLELLLTPNTYPMSSYHYLNNLNTGIVTVMYLKFSFSCQRRELRALDLLSPMDS